MRVGGDGASGAGLGLMAAALGWVGRTVVVDGSVGSSSISPTSSPVRKLATVNAAIGHTEAPLAAVAFGAVGGDGGGSKEARRGGEMRKVWWTPRNPTTVLRNPCVLLASSTSASGRTPRGAGIFQPGATTDSR